MIAIIFVSWKTNCPLNKLFLTLFKVSGRGSAQTPMNFYVKFMKNYFHKIVLCERINLFELSFWIDTFRSSVLMNIFQVQILWSSDWCFLSASLPSSQELTCCKYSVSQLFNTKLPDMANPRILQQQNSWWTCVVTFLHLEESRDANFPLFQFWKLAINSVCPITHPRFHFNI